MPKAGKKESYNLRSTFIGSDGSRSSVYKSSETLEFWGRFTESGPVDLGPSSLSISEGPSAAYSLKNVAGLKEYYALEAQSTNQYIIAGDAAHWSSRIGITAGTSSKYTIAAWINPSELTGTYHYFGQIAVLGGNDIFFARSNSSTGDYLYLAIDDQDSSDPRWRSTIAPPLDQWVHVAVTHDLSDLEANTPKFYINGSEVPAAAYANDYDPFAGIATTGLVIGGNSSYGQHDIAEACVWSSILSQEEIFAVYAASVYDMRKPRSGYLTNPVRTIIRENDYRTGSYPMNVRTGDPDFSGKSTIGMTFDDTAAVDFVSPFAQAKITIQGGSALLHNHWVGLTGSTGGATQDFEFIVGSEDNRVVETSKLIVLPLEYSFIPGQAVAGLGTANPAASPVAVAQKLSDAINEYKDQLFIKAYAKKNVVYLESTQPLVGSSNLIITGTSTFYQTPVEITNFYLNSRSKVRYPGGLQTTNRYLNQNISNPNAMPDLEAYSPVRKGLSDYGIHFTPGENLSPFNDERINIETTEFYTSGTDTNVIEGFTSPTRSKTQLVFNFKSSNDPGTHLFYSTGSPGPLGTYHPEIAGNYGSGFSYWNKDLNRWEMINAIAGNEPRWNQTQTRLASVRGFSSPMYRGPGPANGWHRVESTYGTKTVDEILERYKGVGHPVNTSGFPTAQQYNATGSQCVEMKDFISSPFLLEKIRVEFKGNLGLDGTSYQGVSRLSLRKFFVLCQPTNGDSPHTAETERITAREFENGSGGTYTRTFKRVGKREMVAYGRICLARNDNNFKNGSPGSYQNFINSFDKLIEYTSDDTSNFGVSSSFSMDVYPRLALNSDVGSFWNTAEGGSSLGSYLSSEVNGNFAIDGNPDGGADLLGNPSGRQIATSLDIADLSSVITGSQSLGPFSINHRSEYSRVSPYLLFPEDNLIFGWENIPEIAASNSDSTNADTMIDRISQMKITFFGSLVRNNKEYHEGLNQPLTSDGIHESILGAPLVDQWDVEPINILSGSTHDALFFGDMFSSSTALRGRRGSIAAGDAGNTGSLNRNIHFLDKNVIYADSRVPTIGTLFDAYAPQATGSNSAQDPDGNSYRAIILSNRAGSFTDRIMRATDIFKKKNVVSTLSKVSSLRPMGSSTGDVPSGRNLNVPFLGIETTTPNDTSAPRYNIFSGGKVLTKGVNVAGGASPEIAFSPAASAVSVQNMNPSVIAASLGTSAGFSSFIQEENQRALNGIFFGAPLVKPYLGGIYAFPILPNLNFMLPWLRGFKFGFFNLYPTSPVYHFRRNSFGQMRDLIETPPEGKMLGLKDLADYDNGEFLADQNAQTAPVKVVFMSRNGDANISPLDTNTQNLSQFCTSSEPYYDGESRERDIEKDPPPDLTDKTTIEEAVQQIIDGDA